MSNRPAHESPFFLYGSRSLLYDDCIHDKPSHKRHNSVVTGRLLFVYTVVSRS